MRSRIAALLAAAMTLAGLSVVATTVVAPTASAHPAPATGNHTVQRACDDGTYHSNVNFTYNITGPTYTAPNGEYSNYTFTLLTATYTANVGVTGPIRGPHITVNSQIGSPDQQFPLNANVGGHTDTTKMVFSSTAWPATHAVAPTKTNDFINGSNGTQWNSFSITSRPGGVAQRGHVYWYSSGSFQHPACNDGSPDEYWDLAFPNKPTEGFGLGFYECQSGVDLGAMEAQVEYEVTPLTGNNFNVSIDQVVLHSSADVDQDYYDTSEIDLLYGSTVISMTPTPLPTTTRDGPTILGPEWFEDAVGEYVDGVKPPQLRFTAHQTGSSPSTCVDTWTLGNVWNNPAQAYSNEADSTFDDCSSTHNGNVTINSWWRSDDNTRFVKLERVQIINNSNARLVLADWKSGTMTSNPLIRTDDGSNHAFMVSLLASNAAGRIWAPHETRDLNITTALPAQWDKTDPEMESSAPSENHFEGSTVPVVDLTFNAYQPAPPGWSLCSAAQSQLNSLEGTSLRL